MYTRVIISLICGLLSGRCRATWWYCSLTPRDKGCQNSSGCQSWKSMAWLLRFFSFQDARHIHTARALWGRLPLDRYRREKRGQKRVEILRSACNHGLFDSRSFRCLSLNSSVGKVSLPREENPIELLHLGHDHRTYGRFFLG